jgi:transposase
MVYIGVDLHRKRSQLAALDEDGELLFNRSVASEPDAFLRVFGELAPQPIEVAFEATIGWGWFADLLADAGVAAHMAHPLATRAIATARVKNDSVDARTLAHLLRTHLLPEAWIAPLEVREARRLVRMRASLVRIRSRLKCQIHALVAEAGIGVSMTDLFGRGGRELLADLRLPTVSARRLEANLRLIDVLSAEVEIARREIASHFRGDPRMARLLPIPGIGPLGAATVIAEVWDVDRFPSPERLTSWAGLTPTERSSADHTRRGHISKQGSRWLRWILVEAATNAVRDRQLGRFAARIARRRGVKIARVALARRLLTLCYYALRDPQGCAAYPLVPGALVDTHGLD